MITSEVQLQSFQEAMTARVQMLKLMPAKELEVQGGRLNQTLLKITPKAMKGKINKQVDTKFKILTSDNPHSFDDVSSGLTRAQRKKQGSGDVRWYAFQSDAIFGVAEDYDLTNSNTAGLWDVYLNTKLNKQGRVVAGQRGRQTVYLWQKYIITKQQVAALKEKVKSHIGRLRAGWLRAYRALGSPTGIISGPDSDTLRNESGARGDANVSLSGSAPFVEMRNYAKGAGEITRNRESGPLFSQALKIRTQAMVRDLQFAIHNPTKWRQREADAGRL